MVNLIKQKIDKRSKKQGHTVSVHTQRRCTEIHIEDKAKKQ